MGRTSKKIADVRIVIEDVFTERIRVRNGEGTVSTLEALVNADLTNALNGNVRSIKAILIRARDCGLFTRGKIRKSLMTLTEPTGDLGKIVRMYRAEQAALRRAAEQDGRVSRAPKR
jgi:hypothetical protein